MRSIHPNLRGTSSTQWNISHTWEVLSQTTQPRPRMLTTASPKLQKHVWQNHSLHLTTKIQVYKTAVLITLLYGAKTWVLYRKQMKLLERFHQRCLRSILGSGRLCHQRGGPGESKYHKHRIHTDAQTASNGGSRLTHGQLQDA